MTADFMPPKPTITRAEFVETIALKSEAKRLLVSISGPPGSGKSTVSRKIMELLREGYDTAAQIIPMDGFHYDNGVLDQLGLRARKGSPDTFDVAGFESVLKRIKSGEDNVAVPVFDREADLARAGGRIIRQNTRVFLIEGNYLLLRDARWSRLRSLWDVSALLTCGMDVLYDRLMQRWLDLGMTADEARAKVDGNDMPNAQTVLTKSDAPDYILSATEPD